MILPDTLKTLSSALIVAGISVFLFVFAVWLPNVRLIALVWANDTTSLADKVALPLTLLPSILTNFTPIAAFFTIAIAILAGINTALMVALIRERRMAAGSAAASGIGLIVGGLGIGCAACGSVVLTALVGTSLGAGTLALLPLGGQELGLIGVTLLGYATYELVRQINITTC